MKINFCCADMDDAIELDNAVSYSPTYRSYLIYCDNITNGYKKRISICPWCGNRLPKDLSEAWDEILAKEYNITDPWFDDADKIPEEFKTDEWWKKRGL